MIWFYSVDQIIEDPIVKLTKIYNIFLGEVDGTHKVEDPKSSENPT